MSYVICDFEPKERGWICHHPNDNGGVVLYDQQDGIEAIPGVRYLCKVERTLITGKRFVSVQKPVDQLLIELSEAFAEAKWRREGREISAVIHTQEFGEVTATWYESKEIPPMMAIHFHFSGSASNIQLACDATDSGIDMERVAQRVYACVDNNEEAVHQR